MTAHAYALADGNTIPAIGLSISGLNDQSGVEAIVSAIHDGYRLIDTAYNYGNEEVAEAIRRADVDRSDLFVTTKLPGRHHGTEETLASFEQSRRPRPSTGSTSTSSTGRTRSTGTSTAGAR